MSISPHILVFDSGVGALSIIGEIRRAIPTSIITYASDNGFFPYGTKTEEELIARVDLVLRALVAESHPDIIVVACNTASTVALPSVRANFSIPIVGVVPAIKPAAQLSSSKVIALLGTPGTVRRPYTHQLIRDFAADCEVVMVGSRELVELAERKLRGKTVDPLAVREALTPLLQSPAYERVDTVVLACTHFPLIRPELAQALERPLHWVDSGEAIARRVIHLLQQSPLPERQRPNEHRSVFTLDCAEVEALKPQLADHLPGPINFARLADRQAEI
ncbi:glutamate racemase [Proteobacteria bacterium 005FR1]|nr:glutamate racemase [Proteobacteria bacterium 005FR1]